MNHRLLSLAALLALGTVAAPSVMAQISAVPSSMNFQGRLATSSGNPVPNGSYSIRFSLWDAATAGTEKYNKTVANVAVKNGTFAVTLDTFPADTFNGNLWLEIKIGNDTPLAPRQQLVSVPYAFKADAVKDGAITGASIANGAITADKFASNVFNPLAWLLSGNSGVTSGFLGTVDAHPLELRVNNHRAVRYQYAEKMSFRGINVLGGSEINSIDAGVVGATIAGGGQDNFAGTDYPNHVTANFSTISGGINNTASGDSSTVGGGFSNIASGDKSTVGGGSNNTATNFATVAGGVLNTASGYSSTVAGGVNNTAGGEASFAAGRRANALHNGAFVWGDNTDSDFPSTGINQFLIRAGGGVAINSNDPAGYTLNVNGSVAGVGNYNNVSDARYKFHVQTFPDALDAILALRGVTFDWRRDEFKRMNFSDGRQIGFIAQEVEKVLPELVTTDSNGYKSVAYANVVPVLVEAVKTLNVRSVIQHKQHQADTSEIAELKAKLDAVMKRLDALETHNK